MEYTYATTARYKIYYHTESYAVSGCLIPHNLDAKISTPIHPQPGSNSPSLCKVRSFQFCRTPSFKAWNVTAKVLFGCNASSWLRSDGQPLIHAPYEASCIALRPKQLLPQLRSPKPQNPKTPKPYSLWTRPRTGAAA